MSKQVTLRGIDARLEPVRRAEARRRRRSLDRTALGLLEEAAGLAGPPVDQAPPRFTDLDHLAGTWSAAEADEFDHVIESGRAGDGELWR